MELLVHDLLKINNIECIASDEEAPKWVHEALLQAPWVVVRRAPLQNGMIPVGVRGENRIQRFGAYIPSSAIVMKVTPEQLVSQAGWRTSERFTTIRAFQILDIVSFYYSRYDWSWGITGSVGFELASSIPTARPNSDLDIVIRMPQPLDRKKAGVLHGWNTQLPIRIDVQLETPLGAVALAEYARNEKQVLLRTSSGPTLVDTPWSVVTLNQEDGR
ncbi:malonate decarboxylase holo-ACP synthase [Brevibacillus sp. NRS-1366]|uniref:malonate decarboxylase holo-ACP synthase n=1 Tax=Brevibacillus sp. NRS-1366 TaxID=3233899 RepID=UPI003D1DA0B9